MAKDDFFEQVRGMESKIFFAENRDMLLEACNYPVIVLKSGDGDLYLEALKILTDLSERVVLLKNFEVFDQNVLDQSIKLEKIILSGNIDKSPSRKQIIGKSYNTTIFFSEPETYPSVRIPTLKKYSGYLKTADVEGFVKLDLGGDD